MTFKALISDLSKRNGPAFGAGPDAFKRLMRRLGNPQHAYKIIHIAGTNGKGSVCYLCASVLRSAGWCTGLFISPHLQSPTERMQVNGQSITPAALMRVCKEVLAAEVEKLNYFEILTAAAFLYFAQKKVAYVVLETGLGGRKDPTNVCHPSACVITSIGLDHCKILGETLSEIAREKEGIIKREIPVFCPPLPRPALREIRHFAQRRHAPFFLIRQGNPFTLRRIDWQKGKLLLQRGHAGWSLGLMGEKQVQNACLVYQVCRAIQLPLRSIRQGFSRVQVPGRFESVRIGKRIVILDGAHNPQAIDNLVKFLKKSPWAAQVGVVCGFMADKDYLAMLRTLARHTAALYITTTGQPRTATWQQLQPVLPSRVSARYFDQAEQALAAALQQHKIVLVTGSFYLVGNLREWLFCNGGVACARMRA